MDEIDLSELMLHLFVVSAVVIVAVLLFPFNAFGIILIGWVVYALLVFLYKEFQPVVRRNRFSTV